MPGAGRLGDKAHVQEDSHGCPGCPHPGVGPAISGSANVFINGMPALRVDDVGIHAVCCGSNTWSAQQGSATVFINGKAAFRRDDPTRHCGGTGKLIEGSGNVNVGGASSGGGGHGGSSPAGDGKAVSTANRAPPSHGAATPSESDAAKPSSPVAASPPQAASGAAAATASAKGVTRREPNKELRFHVRLAIDPNDARTNDDRFTLFAGQSYRQVKTIRDDMVRGDRFVDLEFSALIAGLDYSLEVDPGREGSPYLVFENVRCAELNLDGRRGK